MKKRALDKAYEEFEAKYNNMPEEEIKNEIENLEKEIAGRENSSQKLTGEEKESAENEIAKSKQKLENLKGYTKNKNQISKIIEVKCNLETKLTNVMQVKEDSKKAYNEAKKEFEEVTKVLKDEKKIMQMDQNEYNDLLNQKDFAEKEMKKQKEIFEKSIIKIKDLQSKIGKCNLAWRTLFTNKTWDDIQLRAVQTKSRFTKKIDEEEKIEEHSQEEKTAKKSTKTEEQKIQEEVAENVKKIQEEQENENKENNLPEKVTAWTKFKNFFKSIPAKLKAAFGKEESAVEVKEENSASEKTTTKEQKDAFLEGLREYADIDYKQAVKKAKEQQYIDQHKAKSQDENQK